MTVWHPFWYQPKDIPSPLPNPNEFWYAFDSFECPMWCSMDKTTEFHQLTFNSDGKADYEDYDSGERVSGGEYELIGYTDVGYNTQVAPGTRVGFFDPTTGGFAADVPTKVVPVNKDWWVNFSLSWQARIRAQINAVTGPGIVWTIKNDPSYYDPVINADEDDRRT